MIGHSQGIGSVRILDRRVSRTIPHAPCWGPLVGARITFRHTRDTSSRQERGVHGAWHNRQR